MFYLLWTDNQIFMNSVWKIQNIWELFFSFNWYLKIKKFNQPTEHYSPIRRRNPKKGKRAWFVSGLDRQLVQYKERKRSSLFTGRNAANLRFAFGLIFFLGPNDAIVDFLEYHEA